MEFPDSFHDISKKLESYVFSEDKTIGWVLRCHLLTEGLLERIVCACLPKGSELMGKSSFSYRQKLELVSSFNVMSDEATQALRVLNNLRNKCAHESKTHLEFEELTPLGMAFGKKEYSRFLIEADNNSEIFLEQVIGFLIGVLSAECDQIEVMNMVANKKLKACDGL